MIELPPYYPVRTLDVTLRPSVISATAAGILPPSRVRGQFDRMFHLAPTVIPSCVFAWSPWMGTKARTRDHGNLDASVFTGDAAGKNVFDSRLNLVRNFEIGKVITGAQEPARTNLALHSRDFGNAVWAATTIDVSADDDPGPDGQSTADLLTATGANSTVIQDLGVLASAATNFSIWLKRKTGTGNIDLTLDGGSTWTTKTLTTTWTRFDIQQTLANPDIGIRIVSSGDAIWASMAQAEAGTFRSSNIHTAAATVTRSADALRWINSGLFDPLKTEGTMLCAFMLPHPADNGEAAKTILALTYNDGTTGWAALNHDGARAAGLDRVYSNIRSGGASQGSLDANTLGDFADNTKIAMAVTWKTNESRLFTNGVKEGTDASIAVPANLDQVEVGGFQSAAGRAGADYYLIALFDRALTDAEAEALTLYPGFYEHG